MTNQPYLSRARSGHSAKFALVLAVLSLFVSCRAHAQISFEGTQATLATFSSTYQLSPLAVDTVGDVFFVATTGGTHVLYESPAGGTLTALSSTFPFAPTAIAVDKQGVNLYFVYMAPAGGCNGENSAVLAQAPVSGGAIPINLPCSFQMSGNATSYSNPTGLAVDLNGNLYVADNGSGVIYEVLSPVSPFSVPTNSAPLSSGKPYDIALSGNGNVYFTFLGSFPPNNQPEIESIPVTEFVIGFGVTPTVIAYNIPSLTSGLAADLSGNLYVGGGIAADSKVSGGNLIPVESDFVNGTEGLATDSAGDLYIAGADATGEQFVIELNFNSGTNFGTQAVGSTSQTWMLTFTVPAGTPVGSIAALTTGIAGKDFVIASGGTCVTGTYASAATCTVNVNFEPQAPGLRRGAVVFSDGSGNILGSVPVFGNGTGPQAAFQSSQSTPIGNGFVNAHGIVADAAGDLFIADTGNGRVVKITPSGTLTQVGQSFSEPTALAIDGAGNLFVADAITNTIYKVSPLGAQTTFFSGIAGQVRDLAFDGSGNLYISDGSGAAGMLKVTPTGSETPVPISLSSPHGMALDFAGDIYVADCNSNNVYEVMPDGTQIAVGNNLDCPVGLALDGAGSLYVTSNAGGNLIEIAAGGFKSNLLIGLNAPEGVALDGAGNLYFTEATANPAPAFKVDRGDPPSLNFATTAGGSTSSDSPQIVTVQNIGNVALAFSAFSFPVDFPEAEPDGDCTTTTSLAAGTDCQLTVDFSPVTVSGTSTSVPLAESVQITTNTLNASTAQNIPVSGTETKTSQTITFTLPAAVTYGAAAINLAAVASSTSGLPLTFAVVSGPATLSGSIATITAAGSVVVQATQAGNDVYAGATAVSRTIVINQAVLTVTATNASRAFGAANPTFADTIAGFVNGDSQSVVSGAAAIGTTATTSSAVGMYPITPALGTLSALNYSFMFVSGTLTISQATPSITWATPAAIAYGTALSATQLDATSPVAGQFAYIPAGGTVLIAGMHTLSVTFTPTDATDYTTAMTTVQLTVNQATPSITWATPAAITYGTALSATQLDATSPVAGTFAYNPAAATVLTAGAHTLSVTFTPTDSADYSTAITTVQLTVSKATPSISWMTPAAITYGTALSATQLDATSQVAGTFAYNPASATVLTGGAHTLSVTFTPTDATDYTTATTTVQLTVNKATPSLSWMTPAAISYGAALSATQLDATSPVAGSFVYNPAATTVLSAGAHTLSVTLTPTDSADYTTASTTVQLTVNQATPAISWATPPAITYGTALSGTQLDATSPVMGTLAYNPAATTVLSAGAHTLSVTFTPTDAADYTTATTTVQLTVNQATPSISWTAPQSITYGTALSGTQLDATSPVMGTLAYNPAATTVLSAGTHTLSVTFTPTDVTDYTTATTTVQLTVNQATPSITWVTPAAISYGAALSATQLDASASVAGTFAYNPSSTTVLAAGTHTLSVTFTPTDATDYTTATSTVQLTVNQATPSIAWATPASISFGTALGATQLDATSPVAGTFAYNPTATTLLSAGVHTLSVSFTPTDTTDYTTAGTTVQLVVNQATPPTTWATPAAITYGAALSGTQLDATSTIAGTFSYIPPIGTVLPAGSQTLSATFTPTDTADYTTPTVKVTLNVNQATPTISWTAPSAIPYGTALGANQLDASSTVAGTFAYSPPMGTVLTAGAHSLSVTFTPTDAANYATAMSTVQLTVNQATPSVSWATPAAFAYGTALSATQLDATSPVMGTFAYNPPAGTVLTAGTHTLSVTFTPTDAADYTNAAATVQLTVNQATPSISWGDPAAISYGTALNGTQLDAISTVAGTYAYNPPSGTVLTAGMHKLSVTFTPTDGSDYTTATGTAQLTVNQATPSITWATPAAVPYGTPLGASQLDATSPVAGSFSYLPPAGTVLPTGPQTLSVTFTPTDAADYTTNTAKATLTVNQAAPAINWATPTTIPYGTALSSTQLDANSTVAGTFVYNPPAGTLLTAGTHTLSATFTPTDSADYTTATSTVQLTVSQATPSISWATPTAIVYGAALSATQLDATSPVAGALAYSPAAATVLTAGSHTLSATFTPTDTTDYATAMATVQLTVNQATPSITWGSPAAIPYGTALGAAQLDATSPVPGNFSYIPPAGTVLPAGSQTLSVTFTPTDGTDYISTTAKVTLTVNQATPSILWPTPAPVTFGMSLGASQLDASSATTGTFVYSPALGTVLTAGSHTLSVAFTPADSADYTTAIASVTLVVNKATPAISWAAPKAILYGVALSQAQLDASSKTAGSFVYNPPLGKVLTAGPHELSVTFNPTDATDYASTAANVTLTVNKATPEIAWETPKAIAYGAALGGAELDATSKIAGTFAYSPAKGTVLNAGAHKLSVTFTPADKSDYASDTATTTLQVGQDLLSVDATNVSVAYGKPLPKLTYTASGFKNGDAAKVLSGSPAETTTAKEFSAVGQYPIAIAAGSLKAVNYKFSFKNGILTITSLGKAAPPAFKPAQGTYASTQTVTITDATPGSVIYYTTNGTTPTTDSTRYKSALTVKATETIKVLVVAPGYTNSAIATAKYTIN